jgi:hypothetical protein
MTTTELKQQKKNTIVGVSFLVIMPKQWKYWNTNIIQIKVSVPCFIVKNYGEGDLGIDVLKSKSFTLQ